MSARGPPSQHAADAPCAPSRRPEPGTRVWAVAPPAAPLLGGECGWHVLPVSPRGHPSVHVCVPMSASKGPAARGEAPRPVTPFDRDDPREECLHTQPRAEGVGAAVRPWQGHVQVTAGAEPGLPMRWAQRGRRPDGSRAARPFHLSVRSDPRVTRSSCVRTVCASVSGGAGPALGWRAPSPASAFSPASALPRGPGVLQPQAAAPRHTGRPPGPAALQQRQQPRRRRARLGRVPRRLAPQPVAPAAAADARHGRRGRQDPRRLRPRAPQPVPVAQQARRRRRGWQATAAALARGVRTRSVGVGLPRGQRGGGRDSGGCGQLTTAPRGREQQSSGRVLSPLTSLRSRGARAWPLCCPGPPTPRGASGHGGRGCCVLPCLR